ncbi:fibronectin type III domain-containing protein [Paenibacillus wulumuqiensis]|uniref:fibronectin type III domain-containing protein n=1 Tax=Paenibacillus wulumuqiensis TaxID=1567107 RepID=UPI000619F874|nr:S-layer homology domain-containing protein [Paenibacillus wulumuqiensis]
MKLKLRKIGAVAVSTSLLVGMLPYQHVLAASAPEFTSAVQVGDHARLEWSVSMADSDVITQSGFESTSEFNTYAGGDNSAGGQSQTAEDKYTGSYSLKVMDTAGKGNAYWYPNTSSDSSRLSLGRKYGIPRGTPLSITFKARAIGQNGWIQPYMAGGPGKSTYPLNHFPQYYPAIKSPVHFTSSVRAGDTSFTVDNIDEFYAEFSRRKAQNSLMHIAANASSNYGIGIVYIQSVDVANKRVYLYPDSAFQGSFAAGSDVQSAYWEDNAFTGRTINADTGWKTYSTNVIVATNTDMEYDKQGMDAIFDTIAPGIVYLDDFKFGYATEAELYRDGQPIYRGYLSDYEDTQAIDRTAPDQPQNVHTAANRQTRQLDISWNAPVDRGTTYTYKLKGYPRKEAATGYSTDQLVTVTSGIKGYSILIDNQPDTQPSGAITTTSSSWSAAMPTRASYVHVAAVDQKGNVSPAVHIRVDDQDQPVLQLHPSVTDWTSAPVRIEATASDTGTWIHHITTPQQTVNGASAVYEAVRNGTYPFTAVDHFGNMTTGSYTVSNIDTAGPDISFTPSRQDWQEDDLAVHVNVTDEQSGVEAAGISYALTHNSTPPAADQGAWIHPDHPAFDVPVNGEGEWYLHVQATDRTGNTTRSSTDYLRIQRLPDIPVLHAEAIDAGEIALTWDYPGQGMKDGLTYTLINETNNREYQLSDPTTRYVETGLPAGTAQIYRIRAVNHSGSSSYSEPLTLSTLPAVPERVEISFEGRDYGRASVQIAPVASAEAYHMSWTNTVTGIRDYEATVTGTTYAEAHNLMPNTLYDVSVSAINSSGSGQAIHVGYLSLPASPFGFQAVSAYEDRIDLHWQTVTGAVYADLRRNGESVTGDTYLPGAMMTFNDTQLASGSLFNYDLALSNGTGFGYFASLPGIWTLPASVQELHSTDTAQHSKTIQWQRSRGATGYRLYLDQEYVGMTTDTRYTYSDLAAGRTYNFTVQAFNSSGFGASQQITEAVLPDQPTNVSVTGQDEHGFRAAVEPVYGADRYRLTLNGQVYDRPDGHFVLEQLEPGQTYSFTIQAGNESGYSSALTGHTMTLPSSVTGMTVVHNEPGEIILTWNPQPGVDHYAIMDSSGTELAQIRQPEYREAGNRLAPGEWGRIAVIPVNASGQGAAVSLDYQAVPDAGKNQPERVTGIAERSTHHAVIRWNPVQGASQYHIYDPAGQRLATVSGDTYYNLTALDSAKRYAGYSITASNSGGESRHYPVASFVTLPDNDFTVATIAHRHGAELAIRTGLQREQFVFASGKNKILSRGYKTGLTLTSLRAETNYSFLVWTENELGEASVPVPVRLRTTHEAQAPVTMEMNGSNAGDEAGMIPSTAATVTEMTAVDKKDDHTAGSAAIQVPTGTGVAAEFDDIHNHFAEQAIRYLSALGMIRGKSSTRFAPDEGVSRAEFTAMLVRMLHTDEEVHAADQSRLSFRDVQPDAWYVPQLRIAYNSGIVDGFSTTRFRPDQIITREQAAKILAGLIDSRLGRRDMSMLYDDQQTIASWSAAAVSRLSSEGLLQGYPDSTFRPRTELTRAEASLMMCRGIQAGLLQ